MTSLVDVTALTYRRNHRTILTGVDLHLAANRIVGLLGANGAGKTTLMRLLSGLAVNFKGHIAIAGATTATARKGQVAYSNALAETAPHQPVTALVDFWATCYPDFDANRFAALAGELALPLDQRLEALSKGTRMKLQVALTLAREVAVYLLDEPFDGIDSMTRKSILASIITWKPAKATILISDHHVTDIAPLLDEVIVIKDQHLIAHEATERIRAIHHQSIETYYEQFYEGGHEND
ncbi:ATP-binding cassette domain-containing protein [Lacticaseibacillus daqingensis]|uniref:ATP-binding cassette domain-containing protein n=1 Tax=Lacticaseibacillus daqingensis TaxID=2486014 RepID=UPI000F77C9E3|nr:ATP-binding cassette domain-containing protein [Lacticaseibacillus daqingensis]